MPITPKPALLKSKLILRKILEKIAIAMEISHQFPIHLATLWKKLNRHQQFVADRLGLSNKTICKCETGCGTPKFTTLLALSSLCEVGLDELVGNNPAQEE